MAAYIDALSRPVSVGCERGAIAEQSLRYSQLGRAASPMSTTVADAVFDGESREAQAWLELEASVASPIRLQQPGIPDDAIQLRIV